MTRASAPRVRVQRVYEQDARAAEAEYRVLVDRLWPRGVRKDALGADEWAKDVAPSNRLRRWYGHDPARFDEFARRYLDELAAPPAADTLSGIEDRTSGAVVLLTATRDVEHSGAAVLAAHLNDRRGHR